jgi:hypothetical protein
VEKQGVIRSPIEKQTTLNLYIEMAITLLSFDTTGDNIVTKTEYRGRPTREVGKRYNLF